MRNIAIGEWGAYIVLMYDKNASCETKRGDRYKRYTIHNYCTQISDDKFIVHDIYIIRDYCVSGRLRNVESVLYFTNTIGKKEAVSRPLENEAWALTIACYITCRKFDNLTRLLHFCYSSELPWHCCMHCKNIFSMNV